MSAVSELGKLKTAKETGKKQNKAAYLFLAPWFVGLLLITIGPMVASFGLSFTSYNLLSPPKWIGLQNYIRMWEDERLHNALQVTFTYVFVSVPLQLAVALLLAIVLDRGLRGLAFYRSVVLPAVAARRRASRSRSCGARSSASTASSTRCLALFGIEGQGWISEPRHRARHADHPERLDLRLADGDLPGRAPADPDDVLRGGVGRRREPAAAALPASRCRCSPRSSSSTWCCR